MSKHVVINFEAKSIECLSFCEIATKQLCEIDKVLERIDKSSQKLQGDETIAIKRQLIEKEKAIRIRIDALIEKAKVLGKRKTEIVDTDSLIGDNNPQKIINLAKELSEEVDIISTDEIARYETLLNTLLENRLKEHSKDMGLRASGRVGYDPAFSQRLQEVNDEILKSFIYLEWLDPRNFGKDFNEIKLLSQAKLKNGAENYYKTEGQKIISKIKDEMREARVGEEVIEELTSSSNNYSSAIVADIRKKATEEMVGETIRKKTLKVVMECIESKGFIVDRRNIKVQREKNEVLMIAQKASGERAEFRVMLDGKFIYLFDGYEGQACQNDIQPFMRDLEEIYGIKVTGSQEIWSNPDKISTRKYQQIKTNKEGE